MTFIVCITACVSYSVVRSPSMLLDSSSDIFHFLSSSVGAVSPSEFMQSDSADWDRLRFGCSLYMVLKVWCSSDLTWVFSVTS